MNRSKISSALVAAVVVLSLAVGVYAAPKRYVPNDQEGTPIGHPLYGGYSYKYVGSAAETLVCSGKCLVAGLRMSTGSGLQHVSLRDTNAADGAFGGQFRLPPIKFSPNDSDAYRNPIFLPVVFNSGITVKINGYADEASIAVLYLDLDESQ